MGQTREQRRRRPYAHVAAGLRRDPLQRTGNLLQPGLIGKEQGTAAIGRKTIAIEVDQVDVGRPLCDAVLEDASPLIDQRVNTTLDDFLGTHGAWSEALFPAVLLDERGDLG